VGAEEVALGLQVQKAAQATSLSIPHAAATPAINHCESETSRAGHAGIKSTAEARSESRPHAAATPAINQCESETSRAGHAGADVQLKQEM
jgi:hypothetical protein